MVVLLYKSGIPVQLTNDFSDLRFDIEGFLIGFTHKAIIEKNIITTKYAFHHKSEFKTNDKKRSDLIDGFYDEDQFLKYTESVIFNIVSASDMIYKHKFNFDKFIAKANDSISVNVTNFGAPYELFYDRKKYNFLIESLSGGKGPRSYSDGILDGFDIIDYKLKLPRTYSSSTVSVQNQVNTPGYHFYAKNLGNFIHQYSSDEEKRKLKKITILIIFKIREIINEIFPNLLLNVSTEKTLNDAANSINIDLNNLSNFEKMLFLLKKSWGYYYDPSSALPHKSTLPETFNVNSTYSDFEYYYLGLVSFYDEFYKIPQTLAKAPEFEKYKFILTLLPVNALSLIPFEVTKSIIESFIKKKYLAEYQKRFLVRLIVSIPFSLADSFLDYLAECNNGMDTNYQAIYYILGDARTKRYIPFVDEVLTRRQYVFAIHQLWTASKYNFYHIPNGIIPIVGNINPNAYFIQNSHEFELNNALVFNTGYYFTEEGITKQGFEYSANFIHDKIRIFKTEKTEFYKNKYIDDGLGAPAVKSLPLIKLPEEIGNFHMYHPISLIGIQPDLEVVLPEASYYPAFIFQYVEEFEDLKEFDAAVSLGIAITIELALAYFTGALSSLKYLNYLKNASRIYQALTNSALAGEQILIWTALEGATNALAISGSILYSYNNYLIQLSNDPSEIEKLEKLNIILFWLIIAQATASVTFRYKAINAADQFLNTFPSGVIHPDVENLLVTLRTQKATNILGIRQKLIDLGFEENIIVTKFDDFAADVKIAFWDDFNKLSKEEWSLINKSNALENWKYLNDKKITDRKFINIIISNTKVNAIARFYEYPPLSNFLESLSPLQRWRFLEKHGKIEQNILIQLIENPKGIILLDQASISITTAPDYLSVLDVKNILRTNSSKETIGVTIERQRLNWDTAIKSYEKEIIFEEMSVAQLRDFYTSFSDAFYDLNPKQLKLFQNSNRIRATTSCYIDNQLVETFSEWYMSGGIDNYEMIMRNTPLSFRNRFIPVSDIDKFNAFVTKALDIDGKGRFNDTELKYLFNFFENHYSKGNRFVIEIESTLYTCTSCQKFLQAAKIYANSENKILEIKFIAHRDAIRMDNVKNMINE
ncbi:hypothetical protein [Flavobacterium branchiicola]|uniref:EF-hand domain-containing protein n=1 Tax=Flavobacterium branchiicola TaxID=1114875 RepID=A0ABV9P9U4_9FLAO|nr:hypothetical protein [Flavobacterium branchiicola]MBS7253509.1 hypothetical protein [Flavobacterium branchiicola]